MNVATKHLVEMADGTLKEKGLLPEADEAGVLDTDRFLYELCGGAYDSRKNPLGYYYHYAGLEARNLITGYNKDKKKQRAAGMLVYREELDNQPHIKGYAGPMYNGVDGKTGKIIIRYEA